MYLTIKNFDKISEHPSVRVCLEYEGYYMLVLYADVLPNQCQVKISRNWDGSCGDIMWKLDMSYNNNWITGHWYMMDLSNPDTLISCIINNIKK